MPYKTKSDLPESVKHVLPSHAQDIYKEAFNSAWDQYKDKEDRRDDASREETAHKVAWAAVKHEYAKGDDDKWIKNRKTGRLVKAIRAVCLASGPWIAYCPVSGFKMSSKNVRKTPKSCRREVCSGGGVR